MPHVHITPTQARTMTPDKQLTHNVTAQIVKLYQVISYDLLIRKESNLT
jgi:phenylpyruvate tautomerase PptA (4-oxalocrotonate tautomerase family)